MARRRSRTELEAILADPERQWTALTEVIGALPADLDPALGASAALSLLRERDSYWFARRCRALPEPVIAEVLRRLEALPPTAVTVFLREAMATAGAAGLGPTWAVALSSLSALQTSSKERKARLLALARGPLLPAVQAAVSFGVRPLNDMFVVLALDGSDGSVDALLPHFTSAVSERSSVLDRLHALKKDAAPTPALLAMFERVDALLAERNATSPALAFARSLGFEVETFSVQASVSSLALNRRVGGVPRYQSSFSISSTSAIWFHVQVSSVPGDLVLGPRTSFGSGGFPLVDELGLGSCEVGGLPGWYARSAEHLEIEWNWAQVPASGLRGKKRAAFSAWLAAS